MLSTSGHRASSQQPLDSDRRKTPQPGRNARCEISKQKSGPPVYPAKGAGWRRVPKAKTEREGHPRGFCELDAPPAGGRIFKPVATPAVGSEQGIFSCSQCKKPRVERSKGETPRRRQGVHRRGSVTGRAKGNSGGAPQKTHPKDARGGR